MAAVLPARAEAKALLHGQSGWHRAKTSHPGSGRFSVATVNYPVKNQARAQSLSPVFAQERVRSRALAGVGCYPWLTTI
jgi:hypothetical protein